MVDRRRYERLFGGGGAPPVRDAVAAYRNPDGGFRHALEPDGRALASQPAAVELALAWSPAAERERRGYLTVDALRLLRANDRL